MLRTPAFARSAMRATGFAKARGPATGALRSAKINSSDYTDCTVVKAVDVRMQQRGLTLEPAAMFRRPNLYCQPRGVRAYSSFSKSVRQMQAEPIQAWLNAEFADKWAKEVKNKVEIDLDSVPDIRETLLREGDFAQLQQLYGDMCHDYVICSKDNFESGLVRIDTDLYWLVADKKIPVSFRTIPGTLKQPVVQLNFRDVLKAACEEKISAETLDKWTDGIFRELADK